MSGQGASTILPKKAKEIEDVSAGTVVDLKATVFRANEDRKYQSSQGINAERRVREKQPDKFNVGVAARAARDQAEVIAEQIDLANSWESLQKKTKQYEDMARKARIGDEAEGGYGDERYSVDFEQKAFARKDHGGEGAIAQGLSALGTQRGQMTALEQAQAAQEQEPVAFVEDIADKLVRRRPADDGKNELFQLIESGRGRAERQSHAKRLEALMRSARNTEHSQQVELLRQRRAEAKRKREEKFPPKARALPGVKIIDDDRGAHDDQYDQQAARTWLDENLDDNHHPESHTSKTQFHVEDRPRVQPPAPVERRKGAW